MSQKHLKIGYVVWNPFQVYQIYSIALHTPRSEILILHHSSESVDKIFSDTFLSTVKIPIKYVTNDYFFSDCPDHFCIVCQTPFKNIGYLKDTILIGMQYSMAKERHQYGPWRALCDLNLVFGSYSYEKILPFSPCSMVGNPRMDKFFSDKKNKIKNKKKNILYLPTWSDYSSLNRFLDVVLSFSEIYEVSVKLHHLTEIFEKEKVLKFNNIPNVKLYGANDDLIPLLECADVVLSDYSGAIFDAINVEIPVILLQDPSVDMDSSDKYSTQDLAYSQRGNIGPVVESPDELLGVLESLLSGKKNYLSQNRVLKESCFYGQENSGKRAADAILKFVNTDFRTSRPIYQIYIKEELQNCLRKPRNIFQEKFEMIFSVLSKRKSIS